jgi:hypothetical protein
MTVEPEPPLDAVSAMVAEIEVEQLRRYLEVSQATLKATEREMQVVRDQQVAMDSRVTSEFFIRHSSLMDCIRFSHSLCLCVEQN